MPPIPTVTRAYMLACVGLFCAFYLLPPGFESLFALWPIASGQFMPWQPVTYAFLHGDVMHLFFNMLGLWMFGSELERLWGPRRYLQLLAAGALAAAGAQLVFTVLVGSLAPTVGASGALFGLLLAFAMVFPDRIIMPLFPPIPMKAKYFVALFGGLELLMGITGRSGIAHFAHLGGMLGAWLLIQHWRHSRRR
ncbi:rhomboid family intramembrane serine protease [Roseateles sp. BYS180W]|uniref:Rhomboid family intramembrane serine protease n=1 Tax=Roseateles rivi TaxID=3299028 RepID=A0ABW7FZ24_9BURK